MVTIRFKKVITNSLIRKSILPYEQVNLSNDNSSKIDNCKIGFSYKLIKIA